MVSKKKHGFYVLLLVLFCMLFLGGFSGSCSAYSQNIDSIGFNIQQDNRIVDKANMENIIHNLKIDDVISGDYFIELLVDKFNTWARLYYAQNQENFGLQDLFFFRLNNPSNSVSIGVVIMQDSGFFEKKLFFGASSSANNIAAINNTSTLAYLWGFNGWVYDNNGNITGVNSQAFNFWKFNINYTNYEITFSNNNSSAYLHNYNSLTNTNIISGDLYIYNSRVIFDGSSSFKMSLFDFGIMTDDSSWDFYSSTAKYGKTSMGVRQLFIINSGEIIPTPTPTPTPTGGGGGSSSDLTVTNGLITDIKDSITQDVNSGDFDTITSGDWIVRMNYHPYDDPYQNFWFTLRDDFIHALTTETNAYLVFPFLNDEYIIRASDFSNLFPQDLSNLISTIVVVCIVIWELKYWRNIVLRLQSGDILYLANDIINEDISKYF